VIPVVTPTGMGEADARTIAAGTPRPVLMERAGRAVAWRVREVMGGTYGRHVAVICGKGSNGGDGRITAAALREWGVHVAVIELTRPLDAVSGRAIARADVVVDAMYGTGFRGALDGTAAEVVAVLGQIRAVVVAVDIPSGVDGLTGAVHGPAVCAAHTVTFAAPKPGLWFHPGRACAGEVTVADIGIDLGRDAAHTGLMEPDDIARWAPDRSSTTHKWQAGVVIVGGSHGMVGAPMLASRAAMRLGAGIVWAALPGRAAELASGTEVITVSLADGGRGVLTEDGAAEVLGFTRPFRSAVVGPGLGRAAETANAIRRLVSELDIPLVLDADGLAAFRGAAQELRARPAPTVLTPHDGEFAQLTGAAPGEDRMEAARALAGEADAVVLLKGPTTVIADPSGAVRLNPTGGAALATAGSGDVLSGMIAAFCANGMKAFDAASAAAYVHGRSGECGGHTGLMAGDLPARAAIALRQIVESVVVRHVPEV
jgi:hydroxyethylthiazole kinase-like uncharacterized protein yjeF